MLKVNAPLGIEPRAFEARLRHAAGAGDIEESTARHLYRLYDRCAGVHGELAAELMRWRDRGIDLIGSAYDAPRLRRPRR